MTASSLVASQWRCIAGSLQNLKLVEGVALPPLGPNTAVIKVHYCGLNFADMFACLGLYSATPKGEFVPGLEYSGVIEQVDNNANSEFKVGDRVLGVTRFGGYTTRIVADLKYVRKVPRDWSLAQGCALPCQALTAWYGLVELGNIRNGHTVLVHSGAGGTGLWALKFCKHHGAKAIATVSTSKKADELLQLEPSLTRARIIVRDECTEYNSMKSALKVALDDCQSNSFQVVLDSLMGDWFAVSHEMLGPMGRHVVLGAGSMTPHGNSPNWLQLAYRYLKRPRLDPLNMISTNKSVMAFNLIWLYENTEEVGRLFADLLHAVESIETPVHVGQVMPFEDLPRALKLFQSGTTVGKVLLQVT